MTDHHTGKNCTYTPLITVQYIEVIPEEDQVRARMQSIERALHETSSQLSELTGLRLRNLLTDEDFLERRQRLEQEKLRLTQQRDRVQNEVNRFEPTDDVLFFRNRAIEWFRRDDLRAKKLILETVGSNLTLADKILSIEARKPFKRMLSDANLPRLLCLLNKIRTFYQTNPD